MEAKMPAAQLPPIFNVFDLAGSKRHRPRGHEEALILGGGRGGGNEFVITFFLATTISMAPLTRIPFAQSRFAFRTHRTSILHDHFGEGSTHEWGRLWQGQTWL
jgi:hypothetical protein